MVRRIWDNKIDNGDGTFGAVVELSDEEAQIPDKTPADRDAEAEAATVRVIDANLETKALGMVIADLAVAAGLAPDAQQARQVVRDRFKQYYRQLIEP